MKIVTNGKKYRLWDEYDGWLMNYQLASMVTSERPWETEDLLNAQRQLQTWNLDNPTWTEVALPEDLK